MNGCIRLPNFNREKSEERALQTLKLIVHLTAFDTSGNFLGMKCEARNKCLRAKNIQLIWSFKKTQRFEFFLTQKYQLVTPD